MRRTVTLLAMLALSIFTAPVATEAQQLANVPRIGILTLAVAASTPIFEA